MDGCRAFLDGAVRWARGERAESAWSAQGQREGVIGRRDATQATSHSLAALAIAGNRWQSLAALDPGRVQGVTASRRHGEGRPRASQRWPASDTQRVPQEYRAVGLVSHPGRASDSSRDTAATATAVPGRHQHASMVDSR
jgi:hypothetical protein